MRSPIWWFGGKGSMAKKLLPLIPEHLTYVEVFGGGASLLFAKQPSPVEVYNDIDGSLVNMFRVIRDPEKFAEFHRLASLTLYAREEHNFARIARSDETLSDTERAFWFWYYCRSVFSGYANGTGWARCVTASCRGMSGCTSKYLSCIESLPAIHARLSTVQIESSDWRKIIKNYDTPETFFYLDPPYVPSTRSAGGYKHELTLDDHHELVDMLNGIQGQYMLSGYPCEVYAKLDCTDAKEWKTACYAAARTKASGLQGKGSAMAKQPRIEKVWIKHHARKEAGQLCFG